MLETIKSSTEISQAFEQGKRYGSKYLTLLVLRDDEQHDRKGRVAFIAGKKNGNAVWRNKAKRRLREACRGVGGPWTGYDVIFIAKRPLTTASYSKVLETCQGLLEKALKDNER